MRMVLKLTGIRLMKGQVDIVVRFSIEESLSSCQHCDKLPKLQPRGFHMMAGNNMIHRPPVQLFWWNIDVANYGWNWIWYWCFCVGIVDFVLSSFVLCKNVYMYAN